MMPEFHMDTSGAVVSGGIARDAYHQAGHDFWLTRNRHGAGYWDRGLGNLGKRLTESAHGYGEVCVYWHGGQVAGC